MQFRCCKAKLFTFLALEQFCSTRVILLLLILEQTILNRTNIVIKQSQIQSQNFILPGAYPPLLLKIAPLLYCDDSIDVIKIFIDSMNIKVLVLDLFSIHFVWIRHSTILWTSQNVPFHFAGVPLSAGSVSAQRYSLPGVAESDCRRVCGGLSLPKIFRFSCVSFGPTSFDQRTYGSCCFTNRRGC